MTKGMAAMLLLGLFVGLGLGFLGGILVASPSQTSEIQDTQRTTIVTTTGSYVTADLVTTTLPSAVCNVKMRVSSFGSVSVEKHSFSEYLPAFRMGSKSTEKIGVVYAVRWDNGTWTEFGPYSQYGPVPPFFKEGLRFYGTTNGYASVAINIVDKPVVFELWDGNKRVAVYDATSSLWNFAPYYITGDDLENHQFRFWNPNDVPLTINFFMESEAGFNYGNMTSAWSCP